jgi:hypothetical protein
MMLIRAGGRRLVLRGGWGGLSENKKKKKQNRDGPFAWFEPGQAHLVGMPRHLYLRD